MPLETPLLAAARARGNSCIDGLGMLLHQGRMGFEAWFGKKVEVTAEQRARGPGDVSDSDPPEGFKPLFRTSPFLEHNGPFFYRENDDGTFVVGLRIQPKHANARGIAHGGILMTMCDIALGYRTTRSQTPSPMLTTASVTDRLRGLGEDRRLGRGPCRRAQGRRTAGLRQLLSQGRRRAHRARLRGVRADGRQIVILRRAEVSVPTSRRSVGSRREACRALSD